MFRKTIARKLLPALAALTIFVSGVPTARADLFTGFCVVTLTFEFETPVTHLKTRPNYTVTVSPGVADFSPQAVSGWDGNQPCITTLDPLTPARDTNGFGEGFSTSWTCNSAVSDGNWEQEWLDQEGFNSPPSLFGTHSITGTWDAWTMTVMNADLSYLGVIHLTLSPTQNLSLAQCGTGIDSLTMVGVMEFQDP